jgi:hypothetical protein
MDNNPSFSSDSLSSSVIHNEPISIHKNQPAWAPKRLARHPTIQYYNIRLITTRLICFTIILHISQTIAINVWAQQHLNNDHPFHPVYPYPAFYNLLLEVIQHFTFFFFLLTSLFDLYYSELSPGWIVGLDAPLIVGNLVMLVIRWVDWVAGFVYKCYRKNRECNSRSFERFHGLMGATIIFTSLSMIGVAYCWVVNVNMILWRERSIRLP